jgi:chemotaxis protein MotD
MTLANLSAATAAKTSTRGTESTAKAEAGDRSSGRSFESLLTKAAAAEGQPAKEPMRIAERRASWEGQLAQQADGQDDGADASAADPAVSIAAGIVPVDCEQDQLADDASAADGEASDGRLAENAGNGALDQASSTADTRSIATATAPAGLPSLSGAAAAGIATVLAVASPSGQQMAPTASATDGETTQGSRMPQGMGGGHAAEPPAQNGGADAALNSGEEQMRAVGETVAGGGLTVLGRETFVNPMRTLQLRQAVLQPTSPSNAAGVTADAPAAAADETGSTSGAIAPANSKGAGLANASRLLNLKSETGGDEGAGRRDHSGQDAAAGIVAGATQGVEKEAVRLAAVVPSPSHQVAGRVVAAVLAAQPGAEATGLASARAASTPVIKVLRLELQPADLGTITIRLSLKQDSLEIRLEAGRHDTAVMLQRDQDTLARILSSAGYRVDGLSISVTGADGSTTQDGRTGTFQQSSAGGQWTGEQSDSRSSGGRQNASPDHAGTHRGRQNEGNDRSGTGRGAERGAGGDVYV